MPPRSKRYAALRRLELRAFDKKRPKLWSLWGRTGFRKTGESTFSPGALVAMAAKKARCRVMNRLFDQRAIDQRDTAFSRRKGRCNPFGL